MFRKYKSVNLTYDEQGLIYFILRKFDSLPLRLQKRIERMLKDIAGRDYEAVRDFLVCGMDIKCVMDKHHWRYSQKLYDCRREFFERFYDEVIKKMPSEEGID